jgi:enamine deaminase RidA (YjgF/YER057c/UK114 family)
MAIETRIRELGIELPVAPGPAANYKPWVRAGDLVYVSGQLPMRDGRLVHEGAVGAARTVEEGYDAARICAVNILSQVKSALGGDLERIRQLVRIDGHVASADGFRAQPKVINGASDFFVAVLGERAGHARVALGHNELPLGATVEISAIFQVSGA